MFVNSDDDPRLDPPTRGDKLTTLVGFLGWQRATMELKCSGLEPDDLARRAVEPSSLSLLGLIRHMADVERGWFRRTMAGEDAPSHFNSPGSPDGDFDGAVADAGVVAEAWDVWRSEVAFAEKFVSAANDLDTVGKVPDHWRGLMSLRWVLVHMIEEYARHNGHADLLRESIDGAVGQ
ncbi:MAG: DinB family protein [Acidimicrobiia bacterium]